MHELPVTGIGGAIALVGSEAAGLFGAVAKQGETLYEIADGQALYAEVLLHQRHAAAARPGTGAAPGRSPGGRRLGAGVRAVRCPGPDEVNTSAAVHLPAGDLKEMRVLIDFDEPQDVAPLGRQVRVFIGDPEEGWLAGGVTWLFGGRR